MGILIAYCKNCKNLLGSEMRSSKVEILNGTLAVPCTCGSNAVVPHGIYDFKNNNYDVRQSHDIPNAILDKIRNEIKLQNSSKNINQLKNGGVNSGREYISSEPDNNSFKEVGRNDPCSCGSGIKYKKCHGNNK